jgi:hypothetical protein
MWPAAGPASAGATGPSQQLGRATGSAHGLQLPARPQKGHRGNERCFSTRVIGDRDPRRQFQKGRGVGRSRPRSIRRFSASTTSILRPIRPRERNLAHRRGLSTRAQTAIGQPILEGGPATIPESVAGCTRTPLRLRAGYAAAGSVCDRSARLHGTAPAASRAPHRPCTLLTSRAVAPTESHKGGASRCAMKLRPATPISGEDSRQLEIRKGRANFPEKTGAAGRCCRPSAGRPDTTAGCPGRVQRCWPTSKPPAPGAPRFSQRLGPAAILPELRCNLAPPRPGPTRGSTGRLFKSRIQDSRGNAVSPALPVPRTPEFRRALAASRSEMQRVAHRRAGKLDGRASLARLRSSAGWADFPARKRQPGPAASRKDLP